VPNRKMMCLQFALGFAKTLQKTKNGHVGRRAGWCVEVASDRKVWVLLADGLKMFSKAVTESAFSLSDAE